MGNGDSGWGGAHYMKGNSISIQHHKASISAQFSLWKFFQTKCRTHTFKENAWKEEKSKPIAMGKEVLPRAVTESNAWQEYAIS